VADLGLSRNGTRVNGRPVTRRVLRGGDVVRFGAVCCLAAGIPREDVPAERALGRPVPELTRREQDVLALLCRPALSGQAFAAPATPTEIAAVMAVTEGAVKQHLLRMYQKFHIRQGPDRRIRLANLAVTLGLTHIQNRAQAHPGTR